MAASVLLKSLATGTVWDAAGNALAGRTVFVYKRDTTTQVNVYNDAALTSGPVTQPLTTGADGGIPGYVAADQDLDFVDVATGARTQAEAVRLSDVFGSDGKIGGPGSVGLSHRDITPETYGRGYNSSDPNDWGGAINKALVDAAAQGVDVQLSGVTYTISTGIVPPSLTQWAQVPSIKGKYGASVLVKTADVTLIKTGGNAFASFLNAGSISGVVLDGGNNTAWHAPLLDTSYCEDLVTHDLIFRDNYGPAIAARMCWDAHHHNPQVFRCGATDGVNPAVKLYSGAGDTGTTTNNNWFINPRIEDWRTGALWQVGADATTMVGLNRIVGTGKIELSGGATAWGPALKFVFAQMFTADALQITNGGTPDPLQATPFDSCVHASGSQQISLGRIMVFHNGTPTAGQIRSLFNFDGATSGVNDTITWDEIELVGSSQLPTSVFRWTGTNNNVRRGPTSWIGIGPSSQPPLDSGSPTSQMGTMRYAKFTANGSWPVPNGVSTIRMRVSGGGGGGGGGASTGTAGNGSGGGGAAGTIMDTVQTLSSADTALTITIGAGGTAGPGGNGGTNPGTAGGTGGTTTVKGSPSTTTYASANGGTGGAGGAAATGNGAAGLYGSSQQVTKTYGTSSAGTPGSGGVGQWGTSPDPTPANTVGGGGGGSASGTNGGTGGSASTAVNAVGNQFSGSQGGSATTAGGNGTTATSPGCGGGGGGAAFGALAGNGGAGAAGFVELWW